jgi:hypothetical protein
MDLLITNSLLMGLADQQKRRREAARHSAMMHCSPPEGVSRTVRSLSTRLPSARSLPEGDLCL